MLMENSIEKRKYPLSYKKIAIHKFCYMQQIKNERKNSLKTITFV